MSTASDQPTCAADRETKTESSASSEPASEWLISASPLVCWLGIQLLALSLSAARVPLWYGAPRPVEDAALAQMLAAQSIASALLFPWLMRTLATGAAVILISAPFAQLAAMLSQTPLARAATAWILIAIWITVLTAWAGALRSGRWQLLGAAVASAWALGGPILRYLQLEFFHSTPPSPGEGLIVDPLTAAAAQLQSGAADARPWGLLVALLLALLLGGVVSLGRRRDRDGARM